MSRRRVSLVVLNLAALLIVAGGIYDLTVNGVPPHQLSFIGVSEAQLNQNFVTLYLAVFRALGGCLLAVGLSALFLVNGPLRRGERWSAIALIAMVGVAEGVNAVQMYRVGSPFWAPLVFIGLILFGIVLAHRRR